MSSKTIESVLQEKRVFPPSPAFTKQANIPGMEAYRKMVAEAEKDFEGFWAKLARETLAWSKPFSRIRRLRGEEPAGTHHRCRCHRSDHRRWSVPWREGDPAQTGRGRS